MLPPPAPTSAMSMAGTRSRKPPPLLSRLPCDMLPPISNSPVRLISYPSMMEAFAVVPPMSMLSALGAPIARASAAVAMTPAAGPDSITCTGRWRPPSAVMTPPLDCMMRSGARASSARSSPSSEAR